MEGGGDKSNHAKPSVLTATLRLCFAARLGGVNVARALLAEGPRADAANDNGDTPLHLAAEHGHADMVRSLLAAGFAVAAGERFRIDAPPAIRVTTAALSPDYARLVADAVADALQPRRRSAPA